MPKIWRFLSVIVLLSVLAACGGNDPTPQPTSAPSGEARTFGGQGNFIMTMGDDPPTLDPALIGEVSGALIARQIFSGLVKLSNDLEAVPDLAETIDVSDDRSVYTFKLRPNVKFADGKAITADDVKWSLERATDPATGNILAPTYLDDIKGVLDKADGKATSLEGVKVIDERTIEITLNAPSSLFLLKFTHPPAFVLDRRAVAKGGDWFEQPNGSGPFKIDTWNRRRRLELVPNTNYYGEPAKLGRITILLGAEGGNPLGLYEQGDIDVAGVGSYSLDRINDPSDPLHNELRITPQLSFAYIAFNVALPPFDDPNIREAFSLLIDRVKLAEVAYNGTVVAGRGILPPGMPGADPNAFPEPRADIQRAKNLIKDSKYGSPEGLPPIIAYTASGEVSLLAQIAKDELGVNIEIRGQDTFGDYLQSLNTDTYNMYDLSWVADYPDPQNFLEVLFGNGQQYNRSNYVNPDFDAAIAQAKAESNPQKRGELYRKAEKILMDDHVVIPMSYGVDYSLVKPYVKDYVITPLGELDLSQVYLQR